MRRFATILSISGGIAAVASGASSASAADLSIVHGAVGIDQDVLRTQLDRFEEETGHDVTIVTSPESTSDQFSLFKLWLSAGNQDVDVYRIDIIWAPQIAGHFVDLSGEVDDMIDAFVPAAVESQTVDGKLVALPMFLGAPALYYRKDLLEKHGEPVPSTWQELTEVATRVMEAERAEGNGDMWGFVFQGAPYEGLTCNALEWVASFGGGQVVEPDGTISINNERAAEALDLAASWVGAIAPEGVLSYKEEEARGIFQTGNAVFMRNWPYAYALAEGEDSPIRGKVAVASLPAADAETSPAATLGGWNLAVSKYSDNPEAAIAMVKFLSSYENQEERAIVSSQTPTMTAVYDDEDVAREQPFIPLWKPVVDNAVARPSAATKTQYNEVSKEFWTAAHNTLSGNGSAAENLAELERRLRRLKRDAW